MKIQKVHQAVPSKPCLPSSSSPRYKALRGGRETKKVKVKMAQSCPRGLYSQSIGILQARILEWVAVPFSRRPSWPRDRTQVSHMAGGFFTSWATREAHRKGDRALNVSSFYHSPLCTFCHRACFTVSWVPPKMVHIGGLLEDLSALSSLPQWPTAMSKLSTTGVILMRNYSNTQKSTADFRCPVLN